MSSLKPICVPCQRFYRCEKTGFSFIEGMPNGTAYNSGISPTPPGKDMDKYWQPYKLWHGDLWQCEGCGHKTIAGVGREPIAIQHESDFKRLIETWGATFQVNDC